MDDSLYPWYDSQWLNAYVAAKALIGQIRPKQLPEFVERFEVLRTRPDFEVVEFGRVFDERVMEQIRGVVLDLQPSLLERHEREDFGRFVVHNHPYFEELQESIVELVSEAAGEPVEASYTFLSLYDRLGVCPVHLDSPEAKWTLDLCIDQSVPWPIQVSQVIDWPEDFRHDGDDWQEFIKQDPQHHFSPYFLEPGSAVLFSGSSQWHYRDVQPGRSDDDFCHLLFFHFVPRGMRDDVKLKGWSRTFRIPGLGAARLAQGN
ncbi:MAG: hypothetical protein MUP67_00585 [Acidimicrobiia bacterium]|nr:hypothetical protein [Acidimicrobiia bacterium]